MSNDSDNKVEVNVKPEELNPCELGTKEHWDSTYKKELQTYATNGQIGDVWFGEQIVTKIVRYLIKQNNIQKDHSIVDLGCGNGFMLHELYDEDFTNLTGIDYSENAIKMCKAYASSRQADILKFKVFDLVDGQVEDLGIFDICLDKGTYDAVSLTMKSQLEVRRKYLENVHKITKDDGIFILASCNWTVDEILAHANDWFSLASIIPTAQFNFGGVSGNVISIAVLKKRSS